MPGLSSLSNHWAERRRFVGVTEACFVTEARVFSRSRVRWRRARSSDSQSSMLMGVLILLQEQPSQDVLVAHVILTALLYEGKEKKVKYNAIERSKSIIKEERRK